MTKVRVQSYEGFKQALLKAARGEGKREDLRGTLTVENVTAFVRLLTPDNRELLRIMRDEHPESVAALSRRTNRAEPNLLKTLAKLEALGLIEMREEGRKRVPVPLIEKLRFEIDPYAETDKVEVSPA
jgi:predicted transcriptional regulator